MRRRLPSHLNPITVIVYPDGKIEPDETFYVNLSSASGAPISDSQGIGTIVNDDGVARIQLPGVIQFENYKLGGEGVGYHNIPPSSPPETEPAQDVVAGTNVGYVKATEWLAYDVNLLWSTSYDLNFRIASAAAGATFHVESDGVNVTGPIQMINTGGWQTWKTITRKAVALPAGDHTLKVVFDTAAPNGFVGNLNFFTVGKAPFYGAPFATGQTIQAEDYDYGGEGVSYHDTAPTNAGGQYRLAEGVDIGTAGDSTGGTYAVGYTAATEWLEYTLNVDATRAYTLQSRLSSPAGGGSFHVEFRRTGSATLSTGAIALPNTGSWTTWQTISSGAINLTAGAYTMRVCLDATATNGFAGNYNWFRLV